jgi:hypothetical protein
MVRSPTSILLHAALSKAVPFEQYLAHYAQATACGDSQINRGFERETKFRLHFRRSRSSPISSRASQNAAALLFDLGTVDIR